MISQVCTLNLSDDDLSRWHDDDLSSARMELIRTHIATCPACRERLDAFEEIGAGLRALQPPPLDLARLMANVQAAAEAPSQTPMRHNFPVSRRVQHSRRWLTGASGLAAVLILSLLAGFLFVNHGRQRPGITIATATPTATPGPLFSSSELPLMASVIAMSSPSDGWAFASKDFENIGPVIALHYTGGHWTRVTTDVRGRVIALTMLSASDGWLVGTNVYHYDGHSWKEVVLPRQGGNNLFTAVAATAPSSIWISVRSDVPSVLHYDGTGWTRQPLPSPGSFNMDNYDMTELAMASADEGWAVTEGYSRPDDASSLTGVLLHYIKGVWKADRTCSACGPLTISLATPSDGWIGGGMSIPQGNNIVEVKPVLWRLSNGVWKDAPLPVSSGDGTTLTNFIQAIHLFSPTEGWLFAANDPTQSLYRMQQGQWVAVSVLLNGDVSNEPSPYNVNDIAFVSPDEFWTIGMYGITHYDHGVWRNVGG